MNLLLKLLVASILVASSLAVKLSAADDYMAERLAAYKKDRRPMYYLNLYKRAARTVDTQERLHQKRCDGRTKISAAHREKRIQRYMLVLQDRDARFEQKNRAAELAELCAPEVAVVPVATQPDTRPELPRTGLNLAALLAAPVAAAPVYVAGAGASGPAGGEELPSEAIETVNPFLLVMQQRQGSSARGTAAPPSSPVRPDARLVAVVGRSGDSGDAQDEPLPQRRPRSQRPRG